MGPNEHDELSAAERAALDALPFVRSSAVIGLPDKEWGERVTAVIVPKPGKKIVPQDLKSLVKARLSAFKVPKEFFVVDEMPKNPAGKILKRELKEKFIAEKR